MAEDSKWSSKGNCNEASAVEVSSCFAAKGNWVMGEEDLGQKGRDSRLKEPNEGDQRKSG